MMTQKKDIICIAYTTWEGTYVKSTVKLLTQLSKNNRILFVEYPYTIKDVLMSVLGRKKLDHKRILGLKKRIIKKNLNASQEVYVHTVPPTFPYHIIKKRWVSQFLLKVNSLIVIPSIRSACKKLSLNNPIVINAFNPFFGNYLHGRLNEKKHFYYCYDALSGTRFGKLGPYFEKKFCEKVDAIISSSEMLKMQKSEYNKNSFVVKNGVEFDHFHNYFVKNTKKKFLKIGYIGSLDWRFEADIIAWVAEKMPDYKFEFVGRIANEKAHEILKEVSNVEFNPPVTPDEVPAIMFNCDVGIIPYSRHEENKNVYPLKINEYLSVGTAVVMTDFAYLPEFEGLVSVASTKEEFLDKIKFELENNTNKKEQERVNFASKNSWESRGVEFETILDQFRDE